MSTWWTYRLGDFLLFSPRVYWRMFELHNAALWPVHVLTLAVGFAMVLVMLRPTRSRARWMALALAIIWAFVGWSFLWSRYAAINWAMAYVAPAFALQAALLLGVGTISNGLVLDQRDCVGSAGLFLAVIGVVVYPLLPPLFGRPWSGAEVFGIAPDPTAIATLGFCLAGNGRLTSILIPIPLIWGLFSGLTLLAMNDQQAYVPLLSAATAILALILRAMGGSASP